MASKRVQRRQGRAKRGGNGDEVGKYFGDAWSLAKRTATGLNEIRKLINVEEKVIEVNYTSATFTTSGTLTSITSVVQGLDYNERVGTSIKLQNIEVNARIFMNTSSSNSVYRFLIIRDLDGYGTLPTIASVLDDGIGTSLAPLALKNFLNRKRFSILFDEMGTLSPQGERGVYISARIPHEGHVLYLGTTAAAASDGKGTIYVLALSDETTNAPVLAFQSRVTFTDD